VTIPILSTDSSLVNFDNAAQRLVHVASHRRTPAHAHEPACVIVVRGILAKDDAMNLKRRHAFL
jgi:hypothetical protein